MMKNLNHNELSFISGGEKYVGLCLQNCATKDDMVVFVNAKNRTAGRALIKKACCVEKEAEQWQFEYEEKEYC